MSYHGVSLNLDPDLGHYRGIVPCGIREHGVTSLRALGHTATMANLDGALKRAFADVFGDGDSPDATRAPTTAGTKMTP